VQWLQLLGGFRVVPLCNQARADVAAQLEGGGDGVSGGGAHVREHLPELAHGSGGLAKFRPAVCRPV
jgi:hypothetical protein